MVKRNIKEYIELNPTFLNIDDISKYKFLNEFLMSDEISDELLLYIVRYYYKIGNPLITDYSYDLITYSIGQDSIYNNIIYEEDEDNIDREILIKSNKIINIINTFIKGFNEQRNSFYKDYNIFSDEQKKLMNSFSKHTSIPADRSLEDYSKYISQMKGYGNLNISRKYNGWCTSVYYLKGIEGPYFAHNRGRSTHNVIDMTNITKYILPKIDIGFDCRITGEIVFSTKAFKILNSKLETKFIDERSILVAVMSGSITVEEMEAKTNMLIKDIINFKAFDIESGIVKLNDSLNKRLIYLDDKGFDVIDHSIIDSNNIELVLTLVDRIEKDYAINSHKLPLDGVVIRLDNINEEYRFKKDYNKLPKKAYKGGIWSKNKYYSKVKGFILNHAKKFKTINLKVEPIRTNRGNVGEVPIQVSNILRDEIKIGSVVIFSDRGDRAVYYEGKLY